MAWTLSSGKAMRVSLRAGAGAAAVLGILSFALAPSYGQGRSPSAKCAAYGYAIDSSVGRNRRERGARQVLRTKPAIRW